MISHLGTFDVENYGDLLYPIVFRYLVEKRDESLQIRPFSPLPGDAPQEADFETHSVQSLFEPSAEPCTLVVGGGDLLRTDWDVVANHYGRNSRVAYSGLRHSIGTVNAFGYLLRNNILRREPTGFFANCFRARWMNYPAVGPFLIDPDDLPQSSSVSYISCGVPHAFTPLERDRVKHALDHARFIYLRDEQSAEKLRQAGVRRDLRVAPDLTVILSDQFNKGQQARRGVEILSRLGIMEDRPLLCFQSKPYPGFEAAEVARQLMRYRERTHSAVILLPIGYCHGDHEFLQSVSRQSGGVLKYANVYSIFDVMGIIAASDLVVGTSLHANVTALSFGIPHLFGPLPVDKADGCLSVMNLPPELKLRSWNEINDRLDMAVELGRGLFSARAMEAKAKVYQVIDELLYDLLN
jgi:hypothetical protein